MSTTATADRATETKTGGTDLAEQIKESFRRLQANRWRAAHTTAEQRIAKLQKFKQVVLRRKDELAAAMKADFNKPASEVEITELQPVLAEIAHMSKHLKHWMQPTRVKTPSYLFGTKSRIRYEPKGVVLVLSPWNYPFNLLAVPVLTAIAAGNCVMMRPSDKVKATSAFVKSLMEEVFSPDEVSIYTGPSSIGNIMLELPFDHILFTGSTGVGIQIMEAAAKHLASVTLELGGQSPVIVDESADVDESAKRIVWGKYINAGQTCIAPNHIYVHESKVGQFVESVKKYIATQYGPTEDARRQSPDYCRVVDQRNVKRLIGLIERSVQQGAKVEIGGVHDVDERYLAPTVLSGVNDTTAVMEEEIFGPIMPVLPYKNIDQVFASIHSRGKPLAMYVFSSDKRNIERYLKNTSAGGTTINNCLLHFANNDMPFGGINASGIGSYHGRHGFITFSHERSTMSQGRPFTLSMFYPPYTERTQKLIGALTRFLS